MELVQTKMKEKSKQIESELELIIKKQKEELEKIPFSLSVKEQEKLDKDFYHFDSVHKIALEQLYIDVKLSNEKITENKLLMDYFFYSMKLKISKDIIETRKNKRQQIQNEKLLYEAWEEDDFAKIKVYIENGVDVNTLIILKDSEETLLDIIPETEKDLIKFLIDNNGIKTKDLIAAVENNNFEKTKELIEKGIDVNFRIKGTGGRTLLNKSFYQRNYEITKLLLDHGADPNSRDYSGSKPFSYIFPQDFIKKDEFYHSTIKFAKLFIKYGADFYTPSTHYEYGAPYYEAKKYGYKEIVDLLDKLEKKEITLKDI